MSSPHFASQAVQAVDAIRTDAGNGHSVGVIVYGSSASVSQIDTKKMLLQLMDALAKRDDQEIIMASVSTCGGAGSRGGNRAALDLLDDLKLLSITGAEHLGNYLVKYKSSRVTADKLSVLVLGAHAVKEFRKRQTNCLVEDPTNEDCHLAWNGQRCENCQNVAVEVKKMASSLQTKITTCQNTRDQSLKEITNDSPTAPGKQAKAQKA